MRGSLYYSLSLLLLINSLISAQTFTSVLCSNPGANGLPRKDIRDLSTNELSNYIKALKTIMTPTRANTASEYDTHVNVHVTYQSSIHGYPNFFPWHRIYLRHFELKLQRVVPGCTIPYWDWGADSQAPENSVVFRSTHFGGNGAGTTSCVITGPFSTWKPFYPTPHCLRRKFNNGNRITSFYSSELINLGINNAKTYDQLRNNVEPTFHSVVHVNIGSDFGQMVSPNDPLFWCHHAQIDHIWDIWQYKVPNWQDYSGRNANGRAASANDVLTPFRETVRQVFDCYYLCYYYVPKAQGTAMRRRALPGYGKDNSGKGKDNNPGKAKGKDNNPGKGNKKDDDSDKGKDNKNDDDRHGKRKSWAGGKSMNQNDLKDVFIKKSRVDAVTYVSASDRQSLFKLRTPDPVPDAWLLANNHNVAEVRKREADYAKAYSAINVIPNYVSPCALVANPDALKGVSNEQSTLTAHVNDVDVQLNLNGRKGDDAVQFVYGSVDYAAQNAATTPANDPKNDLKQVIGEFNSGDLSGDQVIHRGPKPVRF